MNRVAVDIILDYMEECLFEPGTKWPKDFFDERSFSIWAANEILERVIQNPTASPDVVTECFMIEMDRYARQTEDRRASFIFSTARDTAESILLLFL